MTRPPDPKHRGVWINGQPAAGPLPYRLPGPPAFKFRNEVSDPAGRDGGKVAALPFYERHPEWRPRSIRGRRAKWRAIREGY
jgi:hypothetical protein